MNFDARRYVIVAFIGLVGVIYTIRIFYMQVIDDTWTLRAQEIAEKRKEIIPPRGVIFDRNMRKIVSNRTYYNLMVCEAKIKNLDTASFAKFARVQSPVNHSAGQGGGRLRCRMACAGLWVFGSPKIADFTCLQIQLNPGPG